MLYRLKQAFFISVLLFTYFLLFHFLILQKLNNDFSVFYSAALAYLHHASPYYHLTTSFLAHPAPLAVNVNPPFFVLLISPLTYLDYTTAADEVQRPALHILHGLWSTPGSSIP